MLQDVEYTFLDQLPSAHGEGTPRPGDFINEGKQVSACKHNVG